MIKIISVLLLINCFLAACSQTSGPGNQFDLFNNTLNSNLAKAVEKEDESEIEKLIKDHNSDVNLQDPKFGRTLLLLAIGNDKLISTKVLLQQGANLNIRDSEGNSAIDEATKSINFKKNSFQILELLLKFGANPNDTLLINNEGSIDYYFPLMGASKNLNCAKLLLDNGANPYVKNDSTFLFWNFALSDPRDESIYTLRYLIIEKEMPVPDPISYSIPNNKPLNVFYFLNRANFQNDSNKELAKQDIIEYLNKNDFPNNNKFKEN